MEKLIQRVISFHLNEDDLTEPLTDEQRDDLEEKIMQDIANFQTEGYSSGQLFVTPVTDDGVEVELQGWFSVKEWAYNAPFIQLAKSYITQPNMRNYYYFTGWGYRLNERFSFSVKLGLSKPHLDVIKGIWTDIQSRMLDDIQHLRTLTYLYGVTVKTENRETDYQVYCKVEIGDTSLCDTLLQNASKTYNVYKREK